jgi:hypothetical protein
MEPHPDQEEQPEAGSRSRGGVVAVVVGAVFVLLVVLHLTGSMSLHSP